jgi:hypothetical protein
VLRARADELAAALQRAEAARDAALRRAEAAEALHAAADAQSHALAVAVGRLRQQAAVLASTGALGWGAGGAGESAAAAAGGPRFERPSLTDERDPVGSHPAIGGDGGSQSDHGRAAMLGPARLRAQGGELAPQGARASLRRPSSAPAGRPTGDVWIGAAEARAAAGAAAHPAELRAWAGRDQWGGPPRGLPGGWGADPDCAGGRAGSAGDASVGRGLFLSAEVDKQEAWDLHGSPQLRSAADTTDTPQRSRLGFSCGGGGGGALGGAQSVREVRLRRSYQAMLSQLQARHQQAAYACELRHKEVGRRGAHACAFPGAPPAVRGAACRGWPGRQARICMAVHMICIPSTKACPHQHSPYQSLFPLLFKILTGAAPSS